MKRGRHNAETGSHPFRSLFDLMLALVLLLLSAFVLRQSRTHLAYDVRHRTEELLLLHNLQIRQEKGDAAPLFKKLDQISDPNDPCHLVAKDGAFLTEDDKQRLEKHRSELWQQVAPAVQERLLSPQIRRKIGQDTLRFPPGSAIPTDTSRLASILDSVFAQCYDRQRHRIVYNRIRVEGHTDNQPIASVQFPSNWELSAARAIWLAKAIEANLNAQQVATGGNGVLVEAIGYADRVPVHGNDNATEAHRRLNRRIEIVFENKPAGL